MIVINDTNKTGYLAFCNHIIPYLEEKILYFCRQTIYYTKSVMMKHPLPNSVLSPNAVSPHFQVNNEKSKKCTACGFVYYFNPSSATVALILNEKKELLVCRRAKEPANQGTLDLPGGFIDMNETGEEGVGKGSMGEETGLKVEKATYQFSLPNIYIYSGFPVHTLDMFFLCTVKDMSHFSAMDDVADSFFLPLSEIRPEDFGLDSIRRGLVQFLAQHS